MTTIQSLKEFQSSFGMEPVKVEIDHQYGMDAAFSVFLKPLSSRQRDHFEASVLNEGKAKNLDNLRARFVALCLVDEKGKFIGDETAIGELRSDVIGAIFEAARKLNGMDADVVDEAGKG